MHELVLVSRGGAWAIAAAYFVASGWLGYRLRFLHDEGVFTYDLACVLREAPLAAFFFVKAKPVLMLLSALPAAGGYPVFLLAHAAFGALATVLASEAARGLGVSRPNVAGLLLATSASFVIATANGYPNAEGCLVLCAFLCAYFHERRWLSAALLGLLPFARNELAPVTIIFLAHDFYGRRDVRFVLTAAVLPLTYAATGAAYHHDLAWLVSKFPDPQGMPPALKVYASPSPTQALRNLQAGLLAASPLLAALGLFAPARGGRGVWPLWLSAIAIYAAMTVFQTVGVLGFDTSPRYYVAPLGLLAVLAAIALSPERGADGGEESVPASSLRSLPQIAALALICACALQGVPAGVGALVGLLAAVLTLVAERPRAGEGTLIIGALVVLALTLVDPNQGEARQHARAHRLFANLRREGIYRDQRVYTDLYALRLDRDLGVRDPEVLVNDAIAWELLYDANPANGQYAQMERVLTGQGLSFHPETHVVRRDAVYVIRRLERTARWRKVVEAAAPRRANDDDFEIYWWDDPATGARSWPAP